MRILLKLFLTLCLIGVVTPAALMWRIVNFAEQDQTQQADAAIVLGAGVFRGRPSPVLRSRIDHAVQLYEAGTVDRIVFTGGIGRNGTLSEAEVSANYAIARGVDPNDVLLEDKSTSTIENLRFAQEIGEAAGLNDYLIVSTPYHMLRATWIARDIEMTAASSPTRTIRWRSDRTRQAALVQETISTFIYSIRRNSAATFQTTGQR
ncbi:MAG: YdcF family protein [Chloroflexota bacterium]